MLLQVSQGHDPLPETLRESKESRILASVLWTLTGHPSAKRAPTLEVSNQRNFLRLFCQSLVVKVNYFEHLSNNRYARRECRGLYPSHFTAENVRLSELSPFAHSLAAQAKPRFLGCSSLRFLHYPPSTCRQTLNFLMEGFWAKGNLHGTWLYSWAWSWRVKG